MGIRALGRRTKMGLQDVAKFSGAVALLAIFADAAIGHGVRDRDPRDRATRSVVLSWWVWWRSHC